MGQNNQKISHCLGACGVIIHLDLLDLHDIVLCGWSHAPLWITIAPIVPYPLTCFVGYVFRVFELHGTVDVECRFVSEPINPVLVEGARCVVRERFLTGCGFAAKNKILI